MERSDMKTGKTNKLRKTLRVSLTGLFTIMVGVLSGKMLFAGDRQGGVDFAFRKDVLWYEQPWVWVAAACLFIFMVVLALRMNERNEGNEEY
jgi:hypothetical protein